MAAWVNGVLTTDDHAAAAFAKLVTGSRRPLVLVDAIDAGGAAAALDFARLASAIIDHAQPVTLAPFEEGGWLGTTPGEAAIRADAVLFVGPFLDGAATDEAFRRLAQSKPGRRLYHLGPSSPPLDMLGLVRIPQGKAPLHELIGTWRAQLSGRRPGGSRDEADKRANIANILSSLAAAKYGVIAFVPGAISDLAVHSLMALAGDLSAGTRWILLPLGVPPGQDELNRMALALTGSALPIDFAARRPRHDRWLASGTECLPRKDIDLVLWISGSERPLPEAAARAPRVAAITSHRGAHPGVAVQFECGIPGVDHAAILKPSELGQFVALRPARGDGRRAASAVLKRLSALLPPQMERRA